MQCVLCYIYSQSENIIALLYLVSLISSSHLFVQQVFLGCKTGTVRGAHHTGEQGPCAQGIYIDVP